MKNQNLLDELGKKNRKERLNAILKNSDYILGEEFLSFLEGLLEFAETTKKDPGYFERIYVGEDSSFLNSAKIEMEKQAELVKDVWASIQEFKNHTKSQVLVRTSKTKIFADSVPKCLEEILPCGKCDELIKSHGLCIGCLSGSLPKQLSETLQEKNLKKEKTHLVGYSEICSNQKNIH